MTVPTFEAGWVRCVLCSTHLVAGARDSHVCPANRPRAQAAPGYESLATVLDEALEQAQGGKGKERHAGAGEAFEDQQIVQLGEWMDNGGFAIGQACKKLLESTRLPPERARREILGAINYAAAEVIRLYRKEQGR